MFSSNTSQVDGGYQISRSLRFNSADSAYLNRTPGSASNRTTWTWSGWLKRSTLGANQAFFAGNAAANDSDYLAVNFLSDDTLSIEGWTSVWRKTTQVFRDVSAWYHIVVVWDTTQATAANRVKLYINNVEVTSFITSVNPSLNATSGVNTASPHYISTYNTVNQFLNAYLTEINFIDGQALTPSSFGQTNAQTGVWEPVAYSGSYGTNGFYLNFSDNSNTTAATLGKDYSGNGNNWTPNNFSVSAGAGNDSLVDTPTPYGVDTGAGGTVRGNYCTLNPLKNTATVLDGNLRVTNPGSSGYYTTFATMEMTSGKYYWELTVDDDGANSRIFGFGVSDPSITLPTVGTSVTANTTASNSRGWVQLFRSAVSVVTTGLYNNGASVNTTTRATTSGTDRIFMVAYDADTGKCWMGYQGTWWTGDPAAGTSQYFTATAPMMPVLNAFNDGSVSTFGTAINFGQRPFAYTAPSGFKALCTQNLPTPTIGATSMTQAGDYFNPVLYTGNSSSRTITGVGFQPDFTWIKIRDAIDSHYLFDAVRGKGTTYMKTLYSNATNAESPGNSTSLDVGVTDFASDGFTFGSGTLNGNQSPYTFVAWNWKANGAGSSNTAGSITSTVSANTTSGFSVVTYTGTGSGTATIGHGLGVAPSMIIVKFRNTTSNWSIYHASVGNTKRLVFTTAAEETGSGYWNNTTPTSTVFTLGTDLNQSYDFVAYCFAPVAGYSAFGSYTGNGSSDGPFVFTGMRPAFVMLKNTTTAGNAWHMIDTARGTYNVYGPSLDANASSAEITYTICDLLSNGFKLRDTNQAWNKSGDVYIFMAFASNPFKFALAR
jgi:hypothetical protein